MTFELGEKIRWETPRPNDAGMKTHTGTVVEVVPAGRTPFLLKAMLSPRDHESYVVEDEGHQGKRHWIRGEKFWPFVDKLKRIDNGEFARLT